MLALVKNNNNKKKYPAAITAAGGAEVLSVPAQVQTCTCSAPLHTNTLYFLSHPGSLL